MNGNGGLTRRQQWHRRYPRPLQRGGPGHGAQADDNLGVELPDARLAGGGEGRHDRGGTAGDDEWTTAGARAGTLPMAEESSWALVGGTCHRAVEPGRSRLEDGVSDDPIEGGGDAPAPRSCGGRRAPGTG